MHLAHLYRSLESRALEPNHGLETGVGFSMEETLFGAPSGGEALEGLQTLRVQDPKRYLVKKMRNLSFSSILCSKSDGTVEAAEVPWLDDESLCSAPSWLSDPITLPWQLSEFW